MVWRKLTLILALAAVRLTKLNLLLTAMLLVRQCNLSLDRKQPGRKYQEKLEMLLLKGVTSEFWQQLRDSVILN